MSDKDIGRCRTCLTVEKDMVSIFTYHVINGKLLQLSKLIMLCSSIQINIGDKYPQFICTSCIQSVEQSYLFRLLCEKSDEKLKKEEILFVIEDKSNVQCLEVEESETLTKNLTKAYENVEATYENDNTVHEVVELNLDVNSDSYENIEELDENDGIDTIEVIEHNETDDYIEIEEHNATEENTETFDDHDETYENIEILEEDNETVEQVETEENHENSLLKLDKVVQIQDDDDVVIIEPDLDKNVCRICFLGYPTSAALNRHMTLHRVTPLFFKCDMCPNQFTSHLSLEKHVMIIHKKCISAQKLFKCSVCTDKFTSMLQLRIHVKKHQKEMDKNKRKKTFKCYICGKVFDHPEKMKKHLKLHSSVVKQHKCWICDLAFSRRETLDLHLETHEKEKRFKKSGNNIPIIYSVSETDPLAISSKEPDKERTNKIIYVCKECDHEVPTLAEMRRHLEIHELNVSTIFSHVKFKCLECASVHSTIYEIFQHTALHSPQIEKAKYRCEICDKVFHKRGKLNEHQKTHQVKWPRPCKYCDVIIVRRGDFLPHMNANHDDLKGYPCERCGKRFFQEKNLTMHMKIHSGEKNFMCDVCGISFHAHNNLVSHRRIHSGVKPYKCTYCPKAFSQHAGLRSHMVNHTGERKYECDVCHKKFLRMGSRNNHRKIHTGQKDYSCHVCEKKFTASSTRNKHLLTHTGERNHVCEFCNKAFSRTSNLMVHRKIHLGDKPHVCHICNKGFIQKHVLQSHLRTHRRKGTIQQSVSDESDEEKYLTVMENSENQELEMDYNVEFKSVEEYIVP